MLYNSWEATQFDISEEQQETLARRAAAVGVELFVVDDGWFGKRTSDRAGLGDWTPNPDRFPLLPSRSPTVSTRWACSSASGSSPR